MKILLTFVMISLLGGCVTYYYPETALQDGVYYAQDDPSYVTRPHSYYYPWSSMDYFYLGYYPNSRYGYGFSSSLSFQVNYDYYSPWYAPYYHNSHYYAWRPYRGHHYNYYGHGNRHNGNNHYRGKGHNKNKRRGSDYRYAGNGNDNNGRGNGRGNDRGNRREEYSDDVRGQAGRRGSTGDSSGSSSIPGQGYVSTPPSGVSGNRGVEVRSRGSKGIERNRTQPIRRGTPTSVDLTSSGKRVTKSSYRSKKPTNTAGEVRYRAGSKQGRSKTQPVVSAPNSSRNGVAASKNSKHSDARGPSTSASSRSPSKTSAPRSSRTASNTQRSSGRSRSAPSSSSSSGSRQSDKGSSSTRRNEK